MPNFCLCELFDQTQARSWKSQSRSTTCKTAVLSNASMMITATDYVKKLNNFYDMSTNLRMAELSYGSMMHDDIVHEAAASPVATTRIRA